MKILQPLILVTPYKLNPIRISAGAGGANQVKGSIGCNPCEGVYVPFDFMQMVEEPKDVIGSSYRLREICEEVAKILQIPEPLESIPLDYSGECSDLMEHMEGWEGDGHWKTHELETHLCIMLYQATTISIRNKMLLVYA